jgi:DNA mismatch repair protein MSH5
VQRAQHVSDLFSAHAIGQLLDEGMTPAEQTDLENAEAVCRRFLKWDLRTDHGDGRDARGWLREILGRRDVGDGDEMDEGNA